MKSVCVVLPGENIHPVGGYKITYIYANALVEAGYNVTLVYAMCPDRTMPHRIPWYHIALLSTINLVQKTPLCHQHYFALAPSIRTLNVNRLNRSNLPKADIYIATAVATAYSLHHLLDAGKKRLYLIQDYENWEYSSEIVNTTYTYPMTKICISPWLVDKVKEANQNAFFIPNGLNLEEFSLTTPIERKKTTSICFLASKYARKRTIDAVHAIEIVKKDFPELEITCFGTCTRPSFLPKDYLFFRTPTKELHNKLYNDAAIFIGASSVEGFGLPIGEAMQCGCAIACTNAGGYLVMVKDGITGLVSDIMDPEGLARNILRYLEDDELRCRLARQGNEFIQTFSWDESIRKFLKIVDTL